MPLILLAVGKSVPLSKCSDRDPMQETTIRNLNEEEGAYVISYDEMPLSVQHKIGAKASVTMCSPTGGTILNDGKVDLEVATPGL